MFDINLNFAYIYFVCVSRKYLFVIFLSTANRPIFRFLCV